MRRREFLGLAAAVAAARMAGSIAPAQAQMLAGKQIRVVIPFPAGGPTDIVARPFAQMLGENLKATVIADNRGGAGGSIGADAVAKSAPDGLIAAGRHRRHACHQPRALRQPAL